MALANAKALAETAKAKALSTKSMTFVDTNELTISIAGKLRVFENMEEKNAFLAEMEKSMTLTKHREEFYVRQETSWAI